MLPYMIFHLWIAGDINILAYGLCITIPSYAERQGDLQPPALSRCPSSATVSAGCGLAGDGSGGRVPDCAAAVRAAARAAV